jgi:type I restriction enzyme S subunit
MKLKPYPKYKNSGIQWIGEIPEGWEVGRLKNKVLMEYGSSLSELNRQDGNIKVFGSNGIVGKHSKSITKGETIIIGRKGSYGEITFSDEPCFPIDTTYFIDRTCTKFHLRYLFYLLNQLNLNKSSRDSAVPGLSREVAYNKMILYISLLDQTAIANFLDKKTARIDAMIEKDKKLITLLKEKRTALINHAVTKGLDPNAKMKDSGIEWIGEIPEGWEMKKLKRVLEKKANSVKTGPFGSQLKIDEMEDSEIKVYNQRNVLSKDENFGENFVSREKYEELIPFKVKPGDLLITTRGTIGKCLRLSKNAEEGILHPCLMKINNDKDIVIDKYIEILIEESDLIKTQFYLQSYATTIGVIYQDNLKEVVLFLPPLQEQQKIVDHLDETTSKIDKTIQKIEQKINLLEEYKKSLIHYVVTGKVDVREVEA